MLKKCLKYDLKAIFGLWWIAAATILALSLPVGLCLRSYILHQSDDTYFPWEMFAVMMGYISLIAFCILTTVLVYLRYYNNFFKDEGYLTFTLPVSRQTLFTSKVLSTLITNAATFGVIALAIFAVMGFVPIQQDDPYAGLDHSTALIPLFFQGVGEFLREGYEAIGHWLTVYILEILVLILLFSLMSILAVFLCITIGAVLAKKYKLLASIGVFYGFSLLSSFVQLFGMILLGFWGAAIADAYPNAFSEGLVALILALVCVVAAVVDTILAFASLGLLERRLNLS